MLNAGLLLLNAGRVRNTTAGSATNFNGGTPTNAAGLLQLTSTIPGFYVSGAPFVVASQGLSAAIGTPPVTFANGFGVTAAGNVSADTAGAITSYVAGVPFTATGALAIAAPE